MFDRGSGRGGYSHCLYLIRDPFRVDINLALDSGGRSLCSDHRLPYV